MKINGNNLRSAAPQLYRAARYALNVLMQDDLIPESTKRPVIDALSAAVDEAEQGSGASTIKFATTHRTAQEILRFAEQSAERGDQDPDAVRRLIAALKKGRRNTKQRVYFQLPIDMNILRTLRELLDGSYSIASGRAFCRIADQIDREVLSKSPLKLLADAGS